MAFGTKAGEKPHASLLLLPPATTTVTPALTAASTAVLMDEMTPRPPKLMLATAGRTEEVATQSNPKVLQDQLPLPRSLSTLTL